jgi:uracil-DNA glycosylase family 4
VLDRWLARIGYTIVLGTAGRRHAYHADLHPGFPGRRDRGGDVTPSSSQIDAGAAWLRREITLVRPKAIIALGKEPAIELLARYAGAHRRRLGEITGQRWHVDIDGLPLAVFAAYHPSGVFQFPRESDAAWNFLADQLGELLDA